MHKDYLKFIVAYYYLIIVAYFKNHLELKNKIMCYQSLRVNTIHSILFFKKLWAQSWKLVGKE
jgi:hypothetical protein